MAQVTGIQRRGEYVGSKKGHSNYNHTIGSNALSISKISGDQIQVLFLNSSSTTQGVGLIVPNSLAIALGRLLMTVGEGHLDKAQGEFE